MNVLLSIKPEFAEKILTGEKQYEFRKTPFARANCGDVVVMYASSPVQRLVGTFTMESTIEAPPEELWERFNQQAGIEDEARFFDYFNDKKLGYAIEIDTPHRFDTPINPCDHVERFRPPMSFKYVNGQLSKLVPEASMVHSTEATAACD